MKGSEVSKTARMLAQKQPPFKKCVTAYPSRDWAPIMIGTKRETEAVDSREAFSTQLSAFSSYGEPELSVAEYESEDLRFEISNLRF